MLNQVLSHYLFIFEKFEKDRGRNVPVPRESRASGTRRCGRVFGTAIARVLKIPVTTPIDPPTAPVLIQTPLSLSLCVSVYPLQNCVSIYWNTHICLHHDFRKKLLENPSSSPVGSGFFFPSPASTDDNGSIRPLYAIIECSDYRAERFSRRKVSVPRNGGGGSWLGRRVCAFRWIEPRPWKVIVIETLSSWRGWIEWI